jgi:hypothetical protein
MEKRTTDIWLNDKESDGVLPCGCKLIREMSDGNPGFLMCDAHRNRRDPAHIIIEVEGGLVSAVWSTDKNIHVEVLDRDVMENGDEDELADIAAREKDIAEKNMTYIY